MRRLLRFLIAGLLVGLAFVGWKLAGAHLAIRSVEPPLPPLAALRDAAGEGEGPTSLFFVDSASQRMSDGRLMAHPSFVLGWADGRRMLIDTGMRPATARAFGRPFEWLLGAKPVEPHGAVSDQLGEIARSVLGVAFTHLHLDHTDGLVSLCRRLQRALPVFQTPDQSHRVNHTTRSGLERIDEAARAAGDSGCGSRHELLDEDGDGVYPLPGFAGVVAVPAGGHTPGSTVYYARVGDAEWIFAGDLVNAEADLLADRPKPWLYSTWIIPEFPERLGHLRQWLRSMAELPGVRVVVSHDRAAIERAGIAHAVIGP